jgi:predicted O-linked N-acetylglucosamine transferase (SPINDLY family)
VATTSELVSHGLVQLQAGRPDVAEQLLRQVPTSDHRYAEALHLLGVVAHQQGRFDVAAGYYQQAIAAEPSNAVFHSSAGAVCQALGRYAEARGHHEEALRLRPQDPLVLNNLAITLVAEGRAPEAVPFLEQALRADPNDEGVLSNLAAALRAAGRPGEAVAYLRQALRLKPDFAQAYHNLGNALRDRGDLDGAVECFEQAVRLQPSVAQAHLELASALQARGRLDQAILSYRRALQIHPGHAEALHGLGEALLAKNQLAEAITSLSQALRLRPGDADAHNTLGSAYLTLGWLDLAVASYTRALELRPDLSAARNNLGLAWEAQGKLALARDCFEQALRDKPQDHKAHSAYLGSLNYDPDSEPAALLAEHRRWAERHAPAAAPPPAHDNPRDPGRRLRVGYVSPDFRSHAVAHFLEPILAHHDRQRVQAFCYADVGAPDDRTAYLRSLADHWRDTFGLPDEHLARLVRQDGIDILVDLAGHTANNRLLAFARKPAPVQVSYLGYPCTTGVPGIDYRLVDDVTDPAGEPVSHTEELVRLDKVFCCYAVPRDLPEPTSPPAARRGFVTFGSLHKLEKVNAAVVDLWCGILKDLPSARLLLSRNTLQGKAAEYFASQFALRGLDQARIVLHHADAINLQHLRVYEDIDIALDPFPWSGHTTACEALWMGVPVITLRGKRHAGRMVATVLSCVGLNELIAETPEDYRRIATALAADGAKLTELRLGLRARMRQSALCDGAAFTRRLEEAYRRMWHRWCAPGPPSNAVPAPDAM